MPIRVTYEIFDGIHTAPIFRTSDKKLAAVQRDDLIRKGRGIYRIKTTVTPDNMSKSEQYVYLVYEVRQLQRKYFSCGHDKEVFRQALAKEKELDDWNARTSSFLSKNPNYVPADPQAHAFFLIVARWRWLWKSYFAYKKRSDADQTIVRERAKQCRDFEAQIDNYVKQQLDNSPAAPLTPNTPPTP